MSCGCTARPVNPERPWEIGEWVMPRSASSTDGCVHTFVYSNALGSVGGPGVKTCTGCGFAIHPTWVTGAPRRPTSKVPALPGEAEWATVGERLLWQDPPLIRDARGGRGAA